MVTVSAIARPMLSGTFVKAMLRLTGTIFGALLGFFCAYLIHDNIILLMAAFFLFVSLTVYIALQTKPYNYAAIVSGFTAVIVIASSVLGEVMAIAFYRTMEVVFGIILTGIISGMMGLILREHDQFFERGLFKKLSAAYQNLHYSRKTLLSALKISITASLTFLSWILFKYPYGYWVTITILIIMEDSLEETQRKSFLRLTGQILAAVYGLMVAIYSNGDPFILGLALFIGFFISGAIIGSGWSIADMGNHAGSAIAIMLLAGGPGQTAALVWDRFFNVLAGIFIANLVNRIGYKSKTP